ncbi:MAG TPA: nucleotidyltransferase family protein [Thermodesulfovibrionales bacterium]|nr:nucleotidyltransferase family protein [Thermodesulfovibrionales bacterium]
MGRPKQLLPLGDRTVIEHCIRAIIEAGIRDVVVVLRPAAGDIAAAVHAFPVKTAFNRQQGSEMAESVRTGLDAVSRESTGILLCLADHPLVMPETMRSLAALHAAHSGSIIIPSFKMRRGHPTLFPLCIIRDIWMQQTLRDVISSHEREIVYLNTDDEAVLIDMDDPTDYEVVLDRFRS